MPALPHPFLRCDKGQSRHLSYGAHVDNRRLGDGQLSFRQLPSDCDVPFPMVCGFEPVDRARVLLGQNQSDQPIVGHVGSITCQAAKVMPVVKGLVPPVADLHVPVGARYWGRDLDDERLVRFQMPPSGDRVATWHSSLRGWVADIGLEAVLG